MLQAYLVLLDVLTVTIMLLCLIANQFVHLDQHWQYLVYIDIYVTVIRVKTKKMTSSELCLYFMYFIT